MPSNSRTAASTIARRPEITIGSGASGVALFGTNLLRFYAVFFGGEIARDKRAVFHVGYDGYCGAGF